MKNDRSFGIAHRGQIHDLVLDEHGLQKSQQARARFSSNRAVDACGKGLKFGGVDQDGSGGDRLNLMAQTQLKLGLELYWVELLEAPANRLKFLFTPVEGRNCSSSDQRGEENDGERIHGEILGNTSIDRDANDREIRRPYSGLLSMEPAIYGWGLLEAMDTSMRPCSSPMNSRSE